MKAAEARDVGRAAGTTLRQVTGTIRGVHGLVSDTAYAAVTATLGPVAKPVKALSDVIAATAYGATGLGLEAAARIGGLAAAVQLGRQGDVGHSVHDGRGAHLALAASVGLRGDSFAETARSLAPDMQVRAGRRRVELTDDGLAEAFPDATPDVAVYLHGLCQSESSWGLGAGDGPTHPERLRVELGLTPVLIRYNTGLRVSHNGAALDALLEQLVSSWPVPVRRLVLVGFSMGGLVVHSGLVAPEPAGGPRAWRPLVSDTVTIGTPHHGSPMARGAQRAVERLAVGVNGRRATDLVRQRSVGIKDLTHGNITDADWHDHDPDDGRDHRTHPTGPDGIRHHAIVGVLARRVDSAVASRVGDILVPPSSAAHAALDAIPSRFIEERTAVVTGVHHLGLLGHGEVHRHLHRWLSED
jgi:hypothetical protein